jgi:NADPH-dependent glutamate synthase beta subunit-like oxidoreductase
LSYYQCHQRQNTIHALAFLSHDIKTSSSHEEGADRKWAIATKEFIGDGNGNLKAFKDR